MPLVFYLKSHHHTQSSSKLSLLLSSGFIVLCFAFMSMIRFWLIFMKVEIQCLQSSFLCSYAVVSTPLLKRNLYFIVLSSLFIKNKLTIFMEFYNWAFYFVPLITSIYFLPRLYCLHYYDIIVSLWVMSVLQLWSSSILRLLLWDLFFSI